MIRPEFKVFWNTDYPPMLDKLCPEHSIFSSSSDLTDQAFEELNAADCILILCELTKNDKDDVVEMREMYGIDLAKKLRKGGVNKPIIFTSFLSRKQTYANKLERDIINSVGHSFVQLPFSVSELNHAYSRLSILDELDMYDVINNYCNQGGMVKMLVHSLNGLQSVTIDSKESSAVLAEKLRNALRQVNELFGLNPKPELDKFDNIFPEILQDKVTYAVQYIESVCNELLSIYAPSEHSESSIMAQDNWTLLLLDDEIDNDHLLVRKLKQRNLEVVCRKTADEAMAVVERDTKVVLVVSDYRLEEVVDGMKVHQKIQGYKFLKNLSDDKPGYLRLAALSNLPRKFLIHSFKHYGIRVEIFSKKDYLENESTVDILCDEIVELGNENVNSIIRLPRITSETWMKFEPFYRYHRNSVNYVVNENTINQKAKEYCYGIIRGEFPFDLDGYTALNFDAAKAIPENKAYFKLFLDKCICRRVAIWYTQYNKSWQQKDVYSVIRGRSYKGDEKDGTIKNQININLALSLSEFPWNMTAEEKNWLLYHMGMTKVDEVERREMSVLIAIEKDLKSWLIKNDILDAILQHDKLSFFFQDGQDRFAVNFGQLKSFLHQLYLYIFDKPGIVKSLQSLIIKWQTNEVSYNNSSLIKFRNYLEYLRQRLLKIKSTKESPVISDMTFEAFLKDIVPAAKVKIPQKIQDEFITNAHLFFTDREINFSLLKTKKDWVDALLAYHDNAMKELSDFIGVGFDEVKASKKRYNSDDFDR